ncbi:hypothetical protein HYV84_00005 [Candidatus Woesearchaeota archaeon]|nr:hypothetical protein [Candidatus Woesearchaeota archaeon]
MALKKSDILVLMEICRGAGRRAALSQKLKVTPNYITPILKRLDKMRFIDLEKNGKIISIQLSNTPFALSFKSMLIQEPGTDYSSFLFGLNHRILSYCLFSGKSFSDVASQLNISKKTVMNQALRLRNRQLLSKENRLLRFNKQSWPVLYKFLSDFRNYSEIGNVLWKFEEEILVEVSKPIAASLTGFAAYRSFGIPVNVIKYLYYLPKKKLSKEEVFVHSLLQIRADTRLLELAVVFYHKNHLSKERLYNLAVKYDCLDAMNDFFKILGLQEGELRTNNLPLASAKGMQEMLETYKVIKNGRYIE